MRRVTISMFVAACAVSTVSAAEREIPLRDVTSVASQRGAVRILFRTAALPSMDREMIESAVLTVPYSGAVADRSMELRVCPVTEAWSGGGRFDVGFDEELYARADLDLRRGSGVMTFDVTVPLREILEAGMSADGFVLTGIRSGDGIPGGDASRIAALRGAVLHLRTMELPSGRPPARWLERHRG